MDTIGREAGHDSLATASETHDTTSLSTLPPELLEHILASVPPRHRQRAALSLAHAIANFDPSTRALWTHMAVSRPQQVWPLWRKLKEDKRGAKAVRTFAMESWRGDADILNNVLRCLPELQTLLLNMGTNFAPEHLAELFERVRPDIKRIELCFRPYVEQATYYQFLKGSYFDTAIETMYRNWPEVKSFTHLSIVQVVPPRKTAPPRDRSAVASVANSFTDLRIVGVDTPRASALPSAAASRVASTAASTAATPDISDSDPESDASTPPTSVDSRELTELEEKGYTRHGPFPYLSERLQHCKPKTFAQPIVFFDAHCLSRFGASSVGKNITHLRLRIPSRDIAYVLVSQAVARPGDSNVRTGMPLFPSLRYLDISTTNVRMDAIFATLLKQYTRLEHLVVDRVNLFGFVARDKGAVYCKELGGLCVSAGLQRGKDRERAITTWDLQERTRFARSEADRRRAQATASDEGLSQAERAERDILREEETRRADMQRQIELARSRRGHRSAGFSTFSLRDRPRRNGTAATATAINPADVPAADRAYFVLPPLPTLKTLCIGGEAPLVSSFRVSTWEDEFHSGWREGLAKLSGWAAHVADKYERAVKKADEWKEWQMRNGSAGKANAAKGKGKAKPAVAEKPRPPLDIRLYRFPTMDEESTADPTDPTVGLVEVHPVHPRDYLDEYKQAIADAELYTHSQAIRPPCVLCTVPDCEGPRRKCEDGGRIDGRGGMDRPHKDGCGHTIGRASFGWEALD